ncbi:hypothetical protein F4678DRAFT_423139 [Xylaria arbuscula]|nr:hypothetical protein F4678DRAFT_423139 [Xylaria arbuscula]
MVIFCLRSAIVAPCTHCMSRAIITSLTYESGHIHKRRVTGIHFNCPTIIPIDAGWVINLILIHVVEGPVGGGLSQLSPNSYVHLSKEASVSGDFLGLLLLFRFD